VFALASIVTFLSHYKTTDSLNPVWMWLSLWLAAVIVRSFSQYFSKYSGYQISTRLVMDATLKTMQHMFMLDMVWHERENSGNKIKRIQNAGDGIDNLMKIWFESLIEIGVNLIAINIIISRFDHKVLFI